MDPLQRAPDVAQSFSLRSLVIQRGLKHRATAAIITSKSGKHHPLPPATFPDQLISTQTRMSRIT